MLLSDSYAQSYAIRFRRLYLETVSTGPLGNRTAWRLAKLANGAVWSSREVVATIIIFIGMFVVAMPFGSDTLRWTVRIPYFLLSTATTMLGMCLIMLPLHFLRIRDWVPSWVIVPAAAITVTSYAAFCLVAYRAMLGVDLDFTFTEAMLRIGPVFVVSFGVGFAISPYSIKRLMQRKSDKFNLDSLIEHRKQGTLISVCAQDHYVAVTTTTGVELLRMKLSEAISRIEPGIGLQVHRSHWVAISAITKFNEQARKIVLSNGTEIPVSPQNIPTLTLELSRKDLVSQQARLFERGESEIDLLSRLMAVNRDSRNALDRLFLEVFQGKPMTERHRLKIAHQIYRHCVTAPEFLIVLITIFTGWVSLGVYGLDGLAWHQSLIYWSMGYFLCSFVAIPTHVFVWYIDLRYGSHGWFGSFLHTLTEGLLAAIVFHWLARTMFGPVMIPFLDFLLCTYVIHFMQTCILHSAVREYRSYSSWKKSLNIPPLLLKVPFEARGEIVSISADKRSVRVTTTAGQSKVNKSLKEALMMLGHKQGLQVHRSHWVAKEFIRGRKIKGSVNFVELTTGDLVPLAVANIDRVDELLCSTPE